MSDRFFRRKVLDRLGQIRSGLIRVVEPSGTTELGQGGDLAVTIHVHRPRFYRRLALGGSIGAGESFMDGDWGTEELTALVQILAREDRGDGLDGGIARWVGLLQRLRHRLRVNDRVGSRRNIAAHYDLSNEFFSQFLDPTRMYSCALFEDEDEPLETAARRKLDLICRKLGLGPDNHVVEIGSGWGGFAVHAARNYGCRVTTTTISRQQFEQTRKEIAAAGVADRVTLLQKDYRDLPTYCKERFDALVSIEMIEAVGHRFLPIYFETCSRLLKQDGLGLIQAILIPDQVYDRYRKSVDFIQRHIFPGGCLPSVQRIQNCVAGRTDLQLVDFQDMTPHYATTLRHWRDAFRANAESIASLGFDRRFRRAWEFYFGYCEGGFRERSVGVAQLMFAKPGSRPVVPLPQSSGLSA